MRVDPASLRAYLRFERSHYTRSLVFSHPRFELLALCWEPGQRSPIHNHAGQECWMLVPVGCLENRTYRVLEMDPERHSCRLEPASSCRIDPEHPYHADPTEPFHFVQNPAGRGERAVSLHVYSLPYDRCLVYSPETGRYGESQLHYHADFTRDDRG